MSRALPLGILVSVLGVLLASAGPARACGRSEWRYTQADWPTCVAIAAVGVHDFELTNNCADALAISSDCDECTLPTVIAAGGAEVLTLDLNESFVDIAWETGATSGTGAFVFEVNRCPDAGAACTTSPGPTSHGACFATLLVGVALFVRRRPRA